MIQYCEHFVIGKKLHFETQIDIISETTSVLSTESEK